MSFRRGFKNNLRKLKKNSEVKLKTTSKDSQGWRSLHRAWVIHIRQGQEKPINKKTHKQNFHGIIPGLSRPFPEISWDFCLCVSHFSQEKRKHVNNLTPPISGTIPRSCLCLLVFFSPELGNEKCTRFFLLKFFERPREVKDIPAKFPKHPRFLSSKQGNRWDAVDLGNCPKSDRVVI